MTYRRLSMLALAALCYGCNGDDSPSTPQNPSPVATLPGVPVGTPATGTIGPAGGSLSSSDGVQDDAGYWYVLKHTTADETAGTLTAATTHFSDYSLIAGVQIEPVEATVQTGHTLQLSVRYCRFDTYSGGDDDLAALAAACDNELAPLGTFENWSVNGIQNGDLEVGVVVENGGPLHVTYTAPPVVPNSNPVAISVETSFEGRQALLISNITVTDSGSWTGTSVLDDGNGTTVTASISWTYAETNGSLVNYVPSGSVVYQKTHEGDCPVTSITPSQHVIVNNDGFLSIDVTATPNLWSSAAAIVWPATECIQCSYDEIPRCSETYIGGQLTAGSGEVSQDGRTITDTIDLGGGATLTYTFTKQP